MSVSWILVSPKKLKNYFLLLKKIPFRAGLLDGNKRIKSKNFKIFVKTLKFHYYLVNILLRINVKLIKVVVVQYL